MRFHLDLVNIQWKREERRGEEKRERKEKNYHHLWIQQCLAGPLHPGSGGSSTSDLSPALLSSYSFGVLSVICIRSIERHFYDSDGHSLVSTCTVPKLGFPWGSCRWSVSLILWCLLFDFILWVSSSLSHPFTFLWTLISFEQKG